jgi:MFS family permease
LSQPTNENTAPRDTQPEEPDTHRTWLGLRTFEALSYRDYRYLWSCNFLVNAADWLQILTVGWLMLRLTDGNALLTGTVVGIRTLPILFIGPWAGVLADRIDRRKLMASTQGILALTAVLFAILVSVSEITETGSTGPLKPWHLFLYVAVTGVLHTIIRPLRHALVPNVVPRIAMPNAMALQATTRTATRLIGPALGGVLIEVFGGYNWNFYLESAAYIGALIAIWPLRTPYRTKSTANESTMLQNMGEGLSYIWNHKVILYLIAIMLIPNLVFQPVVFILPIFVSDILGSSEGIGGMLLSVMGVGGVTASIIVATFGFKLGTGKTIIYAMILGCASILVMAQVPLLPVTIAMFLIMGFAQTHIRIGDPTLVQTLSPDELRGRISSFYQFDNGFTPLAVLLIGALVQFTNATFALTLVSAASLIISIATLIFAKQIKKLD